MEEERRREEGGRLTDPHGVRNDVDPQVRQSCLLPHRRHEQLNLCRQPTRPLVDGTQGRDCCHQDCPLGFFFDKLGHAAKIADRRHAVNVPQHRQLVATHEAVAKHHRVVLSCFAL